MTNCMGKAFYLAVVGDVYDGVFCVVLFPTGCLE